ncbi:MAG TPA: bi-domain-containing oxidoreductase [Streptosporangiaceae bacterium]|nr:bi-domain-containing oxidoreductase [Streptosporangiaceae bacterium]
MKTVVQPIKGGPVEVLDVPRPVPDPTEVLVATIASVISPGTERAVTALAQASLLAKARARPDLVRQVARKARADGLGATARAVRGRLAEDLLLGYSAAGEVLEVGTAVSGIRPGQLVATGGAGKASHAQFQAVPGLLCAVLPAGVLPADAAFTTVASIALHGLRQADVGPGSKVVVSGLGLVGQLAARLALAAGCDVAGIDPAPHARSVAAGSGLLALDELGDATTGRILDWSRGRGADAVLVCAASKSSVPVLRAPALCRDRAPVVIVGDTGLDLDRTPFYEKELSLRFARSYGPGRYDASYEAWGVDYPAGQVRWTEGRNFEAVLDLLAAGRLQVADLVTHTFDIGEAARAYRLIEERAEPYLAIRISYPPGAAAAGAAPAQATRGDEQARGETPADPGVGWVGAGAFTAGTLLPAFRAAGFSRFTAIASASGVSAHRAAGRHGFARAVSGGFNVIEDRDTDVVVIVTPHDTHAELAALALRAGRHVWCEKPLALSMAELDQVAAAWQDTGRQLAVGFNRRWSPAVLAARPLLAAAAGPKLLVYRVAAGPVPDGHWYHDRRHGGRLLGEVCHFVDTAQALIGAQIEEASGLPGGGEPGDDAAVSLRFTDGSLATIAYASVPAPAGKEWIEVTTGKHRIVIDDFRRATADGKVIWKGSSDKGHRGCAAAFRQAVAGGGAMPTEEMLATMTATIAAAAGTAGRE